MSAVHDLDGLCTRVVAICQKVVGFKIAEARSGDWAEIRDMLRLGAVDKKWVQEECNV